MSHSKEVRPLEDYQEIGHRWKYGNVWSLVILIGRGLDLKKRLRPTSKEETGQARWKEVWMCGFQGTRNRREKREVCGASPREKRWFKMDIVEAKKTKDCTNP